MTLQPSGVIDFGDINLELRRTSTTAQSLNNAEVRALADVAAGDIALSNLYSKQAVKLAGFAAGTLGTSHTVNVGFGNAYAGRRLHFFIFIVAKGAGVDPGPGVLTLTGVSIGGVAATNMALYSWFDTVPGTVMSGVATESAVVASGSSGNVVFTSPIAIQPYVVVLAMANCNLSATSGNSGNAPGFNMAVTVPSNGILTAGAVKSSNGDITWAGITERFDVNVGGSRVSVGWDNRMTAGGPYPANWTSTGGVTAASAIDSYG